MANRTTATGSTTNRTSPVAHVLHPVNLQEQAKEWLREDTPAFDYGGFVVGEKEETAVLLCKSEGVLAGCPFFDAVFSEVGCEVTWLKPEGEILKPVCKVAHIHGKARQLLLAERVALNVLCRASGVATGARKLSNIAKGSGWHGEVAGTRKTTPGFRAVEKYALLVGGVSTHRMDLSSMIMLKDNHIWSAGNITQAVKSARRVGGFSIKLEVECRSVQEAHEATAAGADIVMLDNFDPMAIQKAARQVKDRFPQVLIEASGGISPANIIDYMGPHIDIVSLSCTTQGYDVVNFSMKILKEGHDPENPTVHFT